MSSTSTTPAGMGRASGLPVQRQAAELLVGTGVACVIGLTVVLMSDLAVKYQVAAVIGMLIGGAVMLHRDRRILLVVLWILVMPLGMEKVFDSGLSVGPEFDTENIVINAADTLLFLLAVTLSIEWLQRGRPPFIWSSFATLWALIIAWSSVSFAIHGFILRDGLVNVAPLTLLTDFRTLLFIVLLQSSIRTRADLITVLIALGGALLMQSAVVLLSYSTGEVYNLSRLTGGPSVGPNTFGGDGSAAVTRAAGTVGYTNQQAAYHTFCTLPLLGLLAMRNVTFRYAAVLVAGLSSVAIILTFARGAWMAHAIAISLTLSVFVWRRMIAPSAWVQGAFLVLIGSVALSALAYPVMQRLSAGGDDGATDSRLRMIALAVDIASQYPVLGAGPGEYVEAGYHLEPNNYKPPEWLEAGGTPMVAPVGRLEVAKAVLPDGSSRTSPLPVHNRYLLSLAELGLPGLLLWLGLFVVAARAAWCCAKADDPFYRFFGIGSGGVVSGMFVYMMVDLFADDKSLQIAFLLPVLVGVAEQHVRMNERANLSRRAKAGRVR